jgi:hypothetical protein
MHRFKQYNIRLAHNADEIKKAKDEISSLQKENSMLKDKLVYMATTYIGKDYVKKVFEDTLADTGLHKESQAAIKMRTFFNKELV